MGIREKATELAAELKRTREFAELKQAKAAVDGIPALRRELEQFNRKQNSLYTSKLSQTEADSKMGELNRTFAELSRNPEVSRYLKASRSFNDQLASVFNEINASLESELKK